MDCKGWLSSLPCIASCTTTEIRVALKPIPPTVTSFGLAAMTRLLRSTLVLRNQLNVIAYEM